MGFAFKMMRIECKRAGIDPAEQLLLRVRTGHAQGQTAAGEQGSPGGNTNLAECDGLISILTDSGLLADESELTGAISIEESSFSIEES